MLMTAAYGAPLSKDEEGHILKALIEDLKLLEKSKDVSGWFSIDKILFYLVFFYVFFQKN